MEEWVLVKVCLPDHWVSVELLMVDDRGVWVETGYYDADKGSYYDLYSNPLVFRHVLAWRDVPELRKYCVG